MSLSVKSMHSWSRAAPRFSMAGILWPVDFARGYVSTGSSFRCKCSDLSFSGNCVGVGHTSEVELALFKWVEVGERVADQLCGEPHCGGTLQ